MRNELRLDRIFREVKELVPAEHMELLTPSVIHGVVPQSSLDMRPQQAFREGYSVAPAQPNDFVISLSSHAHGIEWCGIYGGISPDYTLLRPTVDIRYSRYLKYALKSQYIISQLGVFKTGVRMGLRLTWNKVRYCKIELPRIEDAELLSDFLDRSTTRIDGLIAKKIRFIELLEEKRRALVAHVASKGLDEAAPMKESGLNGNLYIPAHWAVVDFWSVASEVSRAGVPHEGLLSVYLDRGVIPYSEGGGLVHKPSESLEDYQLVMPGNFVMNNQQAWRGSVGISKHRGIVSPAYLVFSLSPALDPDFANYQFRDKSFVDQMMLCSQGVGDIQRNIKWPLLRKAKVLIPPIREQQAIVAYLDRATSRINALISKTERSIELLREHRTALITAAVTGKIDLRKAA